MENHNHSHCHCRHTTLAHCSVCDVVYCKVCGKEWSAKFNWTYTPISYPSWSSGGVTYTDNTGKMSGEGICCSEGHKHAG
jgi:hypothetical protein